MAASGRLGPTDCSQAKVRNRRTVSPQNTFRRGRLTVPLWTLRRVLGAAARAPEPTLPERECNGKVGQVVGIQNQWRRRPK